MQLVHHLTSKQNHFTTCQSKDNCNDQQKPQQQQQQQQQHNTTSESAVVAVNYSNKNNNSAASQHYGRKSKWLCVATVLLLQYIICCTNVATATGSAHTRCKAGQFPCTDGSCILQEKMCDGRRDCDDNSDELDCDYKLCRMPHWFQCAQPHGACLAAELMCNGIDNCPGGEDEMDCPNIRRPIGGGAFKRICTPYEYQCQTDKACIPLDQVCNGNSDCHDNSDELAGCKQAETNCPGFFCANRKCLERKQWQCDGVDDCGDGSDERQCPALCRPEMGKFMCRNKANCLPLSLVCNGHPDCTDGSDESESCRSMPNCSTKACPTAARCQMMPASGAECYCPTGFRMAKFQNQCEDINECAERDDICTQICENLSGSYKCSCSAGYILNATDNRTCHAQSEEQPLLLYTTQVTVMGVNLREQRIRTVATNLTKVIGVAYDGDYIYWTNIQNEAESIVRARIDGSQSEILLTSGLDAPEDLAVDWLTNNIYFSDNVMRHIAVCSNDGVNCVVLVSRDVHQPRSLALWPQRGQMFWSDWGDNPMIVRASMDGARSLPIVSDSIHWPNGIALDMDQERVYWVDAKLGTIDSVRTDGTKRHTVLDGMLKHPYGLAVFEDQLYWSDWGTKSVHACDKFSGKGHRVVAKDRTIYAVHIYHPAKQPKLSHACLQAHCSHLCLLAEQGSFSCACPDGMQLSADQRRCVVNQKAQHLFVGLRNVLLDIEHTAFGRHTVSKSHTLHYMIHQMVYNSVNGTIFIADNMQRMIVEYDASKHTIVPIVGNNLGNVTGLAFDYLAHNLYWTDAERHTIEVISLRTGHRAIVRFFAGLEAPIGVAVMPADGFLYVALRARRHAHIDRMALNGDRATYTHVVEDDIGDDNIKFTVDYDTQTLFWTDSETGRIAFADYQSPHANTFRGKVRRPYGVALVEQDIFWTEINSPTIYWTHKTNMGPRKSIGIESVKESFAQSSGALPSHIPLAASVRNKRILNHPCQMNNGGCSHVCVSAGIAHNACLCPNGFVYHDATNRTCTEAIDCEFRCRSGECLTISHRCNNHKDCPDNSDEQECDGFAATATTICAIGEFSCHNRRQCVRQQQRCDGQPDCGDKSDEQHCDSKETTTSQCLSHQFSCTNGHCVDLSLKCDGANDCHDNSDEDEVACKRPAQCARGMFQCNSGSCIASGWECDGKLDCSDGSDEHDKCGTRECAPGMHRCLLGQCLDARLVCDNHNDCGDFSDELHCNRNTTTTTTSSCSDDQFQCASPTGASGAGQCLPIEAKCNGTAECPRGDDEFQCGDICSISEFQCRDNKQCIRLEFHCDHEKDCEDGSDELNCSNSKSNNNNHTTWQSSERACKANMFDCMDGECVDLSRVCNGFPDCNNGNDEGPQCSTACEKSAAKQCAHTCRPTPAGAVCSCNDGYRLGDDHRSCEDIDECAEQDPCAQLCENTEGSYYCQCYPQFMLRQDRVTCKSIDNNGGNVALLFSSFNEVRNMTEQPVSLSIAWSANESRIHGFDLNLHSQRGYFTSDDEHALYMVDLHTGAVQSGLAIEYPAKLAVDWATDNVYVVSRSRPQQHIRVCNFRAKMCGRVLEVAPKLTIKALAIDGYHRYLFYTTIRAEPFHPTMSHVIMSRLDGGKREMLTRRMNSYVTAMAVDPYKQLLYLVDLHKQSLEVINYRPGAGAGLVGTRSRVLLQKGNAVVYPSGLSVYEDHAYIVNTGAKEAVRCQLYSGRHCKAFNLNILNAADIQVAGKSRQPMPRNPPCENARCAGICLEVDYGYECMCGDKIVDESAACPPGTTSELTDGALLTPNRHGHNYDHENNHHGVVLMIILLFILIGAAIYGGYIYYQRRQRGHRDLNINLHFQNPLATLSNKIHNSTTTNNSNSDGILSSIVNNSAGSSTSTNSTILSSHDHVSGTQQKQFNMGIIQRFFRFNPSSNESAGTELLLESAVQNEKLSAMDEQQQQQRTTRTTPNLLVANVDHTFPSDDAFA